VAEENTTDSTPVTTTPPEAVPPQETVSPDTSTTDQPKPDEGTLLTAAPAETPPAVPPAENAAMFGVPEGDYEISGLPEGTSIDKEALAAFNPIAKELGLSNEGMSKVAAAYANILPKVTENVVAGLQNDIAAQHATWATETLDLVKTDPTFAGKPLTEVQQVAAKALDRIGSPEFRAFLDETGLGNHPEMMKFAYRAGSAISEDTTFERGAPAPREKSRTEKYYGTTT